VRRREGLALLVAGAPQALAAACVAKPKDRRTRVPLDALEARGRLELQHAGEPVELRQTAAGPVARSLLCTHFGCRVRWHAERSGYRCTCHEATFDEGGRPLTGPAQRPLRLLRVELAGREVLIGEP
jgi:cytochrome b6-f complex iron-sulfur subunit